MAAVIALPAAASGGGVMATAGCDSDPGSVECLQERLDECGYFWEPEITNPLSSQPDPAALLCRVNVLRNWACPKTGPCSEALSPVLEKCEETGLCEVARVLIERVRDVLPLLCGEPVC